MKIDQEHFENILAENINDMDKEMGQLSQAVCIGKGRGMQVHLIVTRDKDDFITGKAAGRFICVEDI